MTVGSYTGNFIPKSIRVTPVSSGCSPWLAVLFVSLSVLAPQATVPQLAFADAANTGSAPKAAEAPKSTQSSTQSSTQPPSRAEAVPGPIPKSPIRMVRDALKGNNTKNMFGDGFTVTPSFGGDVIDVTDADPAASAPIGDAPVGAAKATASGNQGSEWSADGSGKDAPPSNSAGGSIESRARLRYVESDPSADPIQAPGTVPSVRVNSDAPSTFKGLVAAHRTGDRELTEQYADDFVRYQQNFIFEVREYTRIIGEALVRQKVIDDDNWVGVEQYLDYQFAAARQEEKALFKPTHELALKRIKPDSQGKVEIYYFFTLNCSWCRFMAADVERLHQAVKGDSNVKMVALTVGETPEDWLQNYREYSGITLPIYSGSEMAKAMKVGFVPALVVVAPTEKRAYMKTGQQSFSRMYEFVRTVQGLPMELTPELEAINDTPIGQVEIAQAAKEQPSRLAKNLAQKSHAAQPAETPKLKIERF